jgi:hypothetical protein
VPHPSRFCEGWDVKTHLAKALQLLLSLPLLFLFVIPEESAFSEVEWGIAISFPKINLKKWHFFSGQKTTT